MALRTPPSWLQNGSHTAENDRLTTQAVVSGSGFIGAGSLLVTANGTPNMTVNVALGWGAIVSSTANAGVYTFYNDATTNLAITTADPTNPRIDRVVVTVNDSAYSGATNNVVFQVLAGTPAASPTAPATPTNSISLATIAVAAGTTSIVAGNITDTRVLATSNLVSGLALPLSGGTLTGGLTLAPATASVAPIRLQSSATAISPVLSGAVEYDGVTPYLTPIAAGTGGRAQLPTRFFYGLNGTRSLSSGITTAQSMFGVGLALAGSTTYEIEIQGTATFTTVSASACNLSVITAFSSLPTSAGFSVIGGNSGSTTISSVLSGLPLTGLIYAAASTATFTVNFLVKGLVRTSAATTFTPQLILSAANTSAFSVANNTNVKVTPVGSATVTNIGAWA